MGNCCPNCLIIIGGYILLMAGLLTIGFNSIVKIATPIAMGFLPLNETLQLWVEIPLALDIKAELTSATTSSEISNRTLALGQLGFKVEMASWTDESEGVFPIVWCEETGQVELLMRYVLLLSEGPLNYAKYLTWAFAGSCLLMGLVFGILALTRRSD